MFGLKNRNGWIENKGGWWQFLKLCFTQATGKITIYRCQLAGLLMVDNLSKVIYTVIIKFTYIELIL
jgi:hypothetical protein